MRTDSKTVEPIGSPLDAYDATLAVIRKLEAETILDCPAGHGAFAQQLIQEGYSVTCADIFPDEFQLDIACSFADLNDSLPFAEGEFDVVTCQNGLHRIWARGRALRELARVTRPSGCVIFTFVNNNNLWRRLVFLLSGSVIHDINGPPHNFYPDSDTPAAQYRYPMSVAQVVSAMKSVELHVEGILTVKWSLKSLLLAPFCILPLLFRWLAPTQHRKYCFLAESNSLAALFGDYLLVYGSKKEAAE